MRFLRSAGVLLAFTVPVAAAPHGVYRMPHKGHETEEGPRLPTCGPDAKKTIDGYNAIVVKFDGGVVVNGEEWIREPDVREADGEYSVARRADPKMSARFTVKVWFSRPTGSPSAVAVLAVFQLSPFGTPTCLDRELYLGDYATK